MTIIGWKKTKLANLVKFVSRYVCHSTMVLQVWVVQVRFATQTKKTLQAIACNGATGTRFSAGFVVDKIRVPRVSLICDVILPLRSFLQRVIRTPHLSRW